MRAAVEPTSNTGRHGTFARFGGWSRKVIGHDDRPVFFPQGNEHRCVPGVYCEDERKLTVRIEERDAVL